MVIFDLSATILRGVSATHFFGCFDLHALKVDRVSLGRDSHDRGHTGWPDAVVTRSVGEKDSPFPFVVDGGVGRSSLAPDGPWVAEQCSWPS